MYSKYDEAQFHLRLPHELHAKIKQRAKMNNRSLNSEIIAAIEESLAKQSSASVYIDDAERMAEQQSDMVKKIVFDTLKELYKKDSTRPINPLVPPNLAIPTATLAGAPPGQGSRRPSDSGKRSTTASPKTHTLADIFFP